MKVLWIVLGVLAALCLLCAGGAYFVFDKAKAIWVEAQTYGDGAFTAVATKWDAAELKQRSGGSLSDTSIADLMKSYQEKFGPLNGTVKGKVTGIHAQDNNGVSSVDAEWEATATFEKRSGTAHMKVEKSGDAWRVLSFDVE